MTESDPHGIAQHEPGAKLDAGKPRVGLMMEGFAAALLEVAKVSTYGARKYTDDGWSQVPDGIARYGDAMLRHYLAERDGAIDDDSGLRHASMLAWNALARLELMIRANDG